MRVKKRVKRGVKKGIKRVKSAPPEAYVAGVGVLVGGAAVLLLATTKTGQELLIRTAQLALHPNADRQEESDEQKGEHSEPAGDADVEEEEAADVEEEPEEDTDVEEERAEDADLEEERAGDTDLEEERAGDTDLEEEPEEDTAGDDESEVTNLEPRSRRPRSRAPLRNATNA